MEGQSPPNLSATVSLEIYASFEFRPMLGNGEQLRKLSITVEQLQIHSAKGRSYSQTTAIQYLRVRPSQLPSDGGSARAEIHRHRGSLTLIAQPQNHLARWKRPPNHGHNMLSRYQKHGRNSDLDAAAQANLAMAKFMQCQVDDTEISLDVPVTLYRSALSARPVGHPDRPSTLIQLATVHFAHFEKGGNEGDAAQGDAFLHEATELSSTESHENRAANSLLQLHAGRKTGPVQADSQSSVMQSSASGSMGNDPWTFTGQLLRRFERFGDLDDLQQDNLRSGGICPISFNYEPTGP
ncbi:hypothetical protein J3R83DRAFT_3251 [Lanmaoa asiatica]|nr:hypothetical protein J3R83DRAFT_3251 [Lanmaoa asiatica]